MMECTEVNTPDYARSSYFYANTFRGDVPDPRREEWLIRSAIADIMCATNDYASLNEISRILFERGDIDRAFRYVADHCMTDALAYNGKLRAWQISQFFPEIERAYQEKHLRQTRRMAMMMFIAVALLLLLLLMLLFIFKRQQILDSMREKLQESYMQIDERNRDLTAINNRLVALNSQMQEADKVKQEYIALFLGILSENISKTRQYRHHVLKSIRQGNTKALEQEIELLPSMDDDILEFYKMFDETFVNLYPDFVDKFNDLLVEGAAIVPKGDDILTPELRIFALIKLGITDSSKIASLLHYSANTIYNYRAKIKNKARGSRSEFETAVRNIE
jgi:DNA-binding CsgD family transcriptional regulator